ncbi:sulfotransferase [Novosphingobium sp. YJ-S2-02]|uniref:Sulfotransferase n=1 Tax=Novosphingobium aureum TaxID=2792964 RepID=A0A931HCU2_9SPHN|nr:sulfotransferase [Novosphingobium aureum]MBH0113700.1 sulfotransferase [Novosphingobium aureum]
MTTTAASHSGAPPPIAQRAASEDAGWHPSFVVIGAVKAATTWIQMRLRENPDVFMPACEPHFFSSGYDAGEAHYRTFFEQRPSGVRVIGEKSADYLAHPMAAARMARMLPEVRLAVLLRDPVERAYSDYKMLYRRGTVKGPPEAYLTRPGSAYQRFLFDGLYARHLERWLELFPREALLAFCHEDVAQRPRAIIEAVSHHIGVTPVLVEPHAARTENDSSTAILPLPLRKALSPFKRAVRPWRGTPVFEGTRALFAREIAYPPLSADLRARLCDFYASDTERLEQMLGIDLSHWQCSPGASRQHGRS